MKASIVVLALLAPGVRVAGLFGDSMVLYDRDGLPASPFRTDR